MRKHSRADCHLKLRKAGRGAKQHTCIIFLVKIDIVVRAEKERRGPHIYLSLVIAYYLK